MIRASDELKRQLILASMLLRWFCPAIHCALISAQLSIRRYSHWRINTFSSISAIINQLLYYGVCTNSNRSQICFTLSSTGVSYNEPGLWEVIFSITSVIRSALGFKPGMYDTNFVKSFFVLLSINWTYCFPVKGSLAMIIVQISLRSYS